MSKEIHEVQMDVMEWVEIGDLKEMIRHSHEPVSLYVLTVRHIGICHSSSSSTST